MPYQHSHAPSALRTRLLYTLRAIDRRLKTLCGVLALAEETAAISASEAADALIAIEQLADAVLALAEVAERIPVGPHPYVRTPPRME